MNSPIRYITWILLICLFTYIYYALSQPEMLHIGAGSGDFQAYWIYGKTFLNGGNPYSSEIVSLTAKSFGLPEFIAPLYIPPHGLPIISVVALLDLDTARKLWFITCIFLIPFSLYVLSSINHQSLHLNKRLKLYILIFIFLPFYLNLSLGQITPLLLFIYILSLQIITKGRYYCAGLLVSLLTIKPHLFLFVFLTFFILTIKVKKYDFLVGLITGVMILFLPAILINPEILPIYISNMLQNQAEWKTPTIASWLYLKFNLELTTARLIPLVLGVVVFGLFVKNWKISSPDKLLIWANFALLLSILTAPYLWSYDYILILPAQALFLINYNKAIGTKGYALLIILNSLLWLAPNNYIYDFWFILPNLIVLLILFLLIILEKFPSDITITSIKKCP